jgi:hypothetical protein
MMNKAGHCIHSIKINHTSWLPDAIIDSLINTPYILEQQLTQLQLAVTCKGNKCLKFIEYAEKRNSKELYDRSGQFLNVATYYIVHNYIL